MTDIDNQKKLLQSSRFFNRFSQEVLDALAPRLTECRFEAGRIICLKGDVSDCLYFIDTGEVEVSISSVEGKVIVLGSLSSGDVVGEIGLLDGQGRTANIIAISDVILYRLDRDDFDALLTRFGTAEFLALTSYICALFRRVTNNLEEATFHDASIRIAFKIQELLKHSEDKNDTRAFIKISQENLGRMAGLSREATNKALSRLEEIGLIARGYRGFEVPDIKKFREMIQGAAASG